MQRSVLAAKECVDLDLDSTAHLLKGGCLPALCLPRAGLCGANGNWAMRKLSPQDGAQCVWRLTL